MALIDDLRGMEQDIPPSHQPSLSELPELCGAIIAYVEHGPALIEAANSDNPQDLADLLGNPTTPPSDPVVDKPPGKPGQGPKA